MQRRILQMMGAAGLVAAIAAAVPALAADRGPTHKHVPFTNTAVGALISSTQTVYKNHDSVAGDGAAVVTNASATSDTGVAYYIRGSEDFTDGFTLSAPNSQGIITFTGTGHYLGGTGKFKRIYGSYTFTGTYDTRTGVINLTEKGTVSY